MTENETLVAATCMKAGKIMLENGSEVYRVEDTMNRIAKNAGFPASVSYVTVTGIMLALKEGEATRLEDVQERSMNLSKVVAVNQLSRKYAKKQLTLHELYLKLSVVAQNPPPFGLGLQTLCAGFVSATLMYIYGGTWADFLATFVTGALGYVAAYYGKRWLQVRYLDMFVASFLIGFLASTAVRFSFAQGVDHIIIGAVMPLVPGIAITNAFRDVIAGDLLSGTARGAEAIFTAAAIGAGIASALILMGGG